jgi:hypothetical protein
MSNGSPVDGRGLPIVKLVPRTKHKATKKYHQLSGIGHRLNDSLLKKLEPQVVKAFEAGKISRQCVQELTHVKPDRQASRRRTIC